MLVDSKKNARPKFRSSKRLRRILAGALLFVGAGALWRAYWIRSVTIELGGGYSLTYSIDWGRLQRTDELRFSRGWLPVFRGSSGEMEIGERPDRAGVTVYVSSDGTRYFLGHIYGGFEFDARTGYLTKSCGFDRRPLTDLGQELLRLRDWRERDAIDPGSAVLAPGPEATGEPQQPPPPSKYYLGLNYVGEFRLIYRDRLSWRGDDVGFVPPSKAPEPRFGLNVSCG